MDEAITLGDILWFLFYYSAFYLTFHIARNLHRAHALRTSKWEKLVQKDDDGQIPKLGAAIAGLTMNQNSSKKGEL